MDVSNVKLMCCCKPSTAQSLERCVFFNLDLLLFSLVAVCCKKKTDFVSTMHGD